MTKNENNKMNIVILTAGKGSRMKSNLPKILHKVGGLTLFGHIMLLVKKLKVEKNVIVITSQDIIDNYKDKLPEKEDNFNYVIQKDRLGTGHAVKCALDSKFWSKSKRRKYHYTGIFYGDVPFISDKTIDKMFKLQSKYDLIILGFEPKDQTRAYGRLFTENDVKIGQNSKLYQIKEFKDLMREKPTLCNSGIMIGKTEIFEKLLPLIKNDNKAKEFYLTDIVELANNNGYNVGTLICDENEVIGINSREELAHAEKYFQEQQIKKHFSNGATMYNKNSIYFSYDTQIGQDVIIEPNVFFGVNVKIGNNCHIKAGCYLENVEIKDNSDIGPYARTRGKQTIIKSNVHIGNFVEIKNSQIGSGTKVGHFGYIGDAIIGENANIGAGLVICNYDGQKKYQTIIGNDCFLGSNATIIAPCKMENESYVAGGSTITHNVEKHSLAIGRAKQVNIENWMIKKGLVKNENNKNDNNDKYNEESKNKK